MFSLNQINIIIDRIVTQALLHPYLMEIKAMGVDKYDTFITDGHSEYFGKANQNLSSAPPHDSLSIAKTSNKETFLRHLKLHEEGKTNYIEMSKGLAESDVEKWTFDTKQITIACYDIGFKEILVETII